VPSPRLFVHSELEGTYPILDEDYLQFEAPKLFVHSELEGTHPVVDATYAGVNYFFQTRIFFFSPQ
jgi:hypothetical protein